MAQWSGSWRQLQDLCPFLGGLSHLLFLQKEVDQLLHPGGMRVQTNLCSVCQSSYDFCVRAVRPLREQFDAPQVVWRDDPRLHLQAPAVGVVVTADWRHTMTEDEQGPKHNQYAEFHLVSC